MRYGRVEYPISEEVGTRLNNFSSIFHDAHSSCPIPGRHVSYLASSSDRCPTGILQVAIAEEFVQEQSLHLSCLGSR